MSKDKMQDVMPLSFDFKRGEQPSAEKLTKWAQLTDIALERVTQAIGDPWDYTPHYNSSGTRYYLSIENLSQASLARFSGPSSLVSPGGNTLGEKVGIPYSINLSPGRNTWYIGFPLCTSKSLDYVVTPTSTDDNIESINLDEVTFLYTSGATEMVEFMTRKDTATEVLEDGDYYIDWRTGLVTCYAVLSEEVVMTVPEVAQLQFFGSGAPWTTHNVIPDWQEGSNTGVTVTYLSDINGSFSYNIDLPSVQGLPRVGDPGSVPGSNEVTIPGVAAEGSQYRLPYALVGLGAAEVVPEGFLYLWDNTTSSIVQLTQFSTGDSPNQLTSLRVTCPELPEVSTSGASNSNRYRIITVGASLAEQVGWLTAAFRNNTHVGLSDENEGVINKTLAYTPPVKHSSVSERYGVTSSVPAGDSLYVNKLSFVESKYPTNDHPQYLHRGGFMSEDIANSKNAMRGHLAFSSVDDFNINTIGNDAGILTRTYGLTFGGGEEISGASYAGPPRITWEGGTDLDPQTTENSPANRLGFGVPGVGLNPSPAPTYWGALTYTPYRTAPLYIRGHATGTRTSQGVGGSIGFDLGQQSELNYMTVRWNPTYDDAHQPARTSGQVNPSTPHPIMPGASGKISSHQWREFRFRAVGLVDQATNTASYSDNTGNPIPEMEKYFVGPSVIGADFLNVYSNAIMFSNQGDGRLTTMQEMMATWLNDPSNNDRPAGVFYEPNGSDTRMVFSVTNGSTASTEPLKLGYEDIFIGGSDTDRIGIRSGTGGNTIDSGGIDIASNELLRLSSQNGNIVGQATASESYIKWRGGYYTVIENGQGVNPNSYVRVGRSDGNSHIDIHSSQGIFHTADAQITFDSGAHMAMEAADSFFITASKESTSGYLGLFSGDTLVYPSGVGNNDTLLSAESDTYIYSRNDIIIKPNANDSGDGRLAMFLSFNRPTHGTSATFECWLEEDPDNNCYFVKCLGDKPGV